MAIFRLPQVDKLVQRLNEFAHQSIVVEGPRQTGKTTLIQQASDQVDIPNEFVSLDEPASHRSHPDETIGETPSWQFHKLEQVIKTWQRAREKADKSSKGDMYQGA